MSVGYHRAYRVYRNSKKEELSTSTVAFIIHIDCVAREKGRKREVEVGRSRLGFSDSDIGRLSGLKYKLGCHFKLLVDLVEGGIREFVYDSDSPEKEIGEIRCG